MWVIDPDREEARVYRSDGAVFIVARDRSLDGEDILPRFSCTLESILDWPAQTSR